METAEITKVNPEQFIEQGLKKFEEVEITQQSLIELRDSVKDLTIKDADDKEGFKAVQEARKLLKKRRNFIEKVADNTRELAKRFNKAIIEREKEFVALIEPTEKALEEKENWYYEERERIRLEEEKKESDRIQSMIDQLHEYNFAVDFHELKGMTDEQFQTTLAEAKEKYAEKARLMEIELTKEKERVRLEAEERKKEEERLLKLRQEQEERERKFKEEQEIRDRKLKEEREELERFHNKIREQQAAKEKELREREAEIKRQEQEKIREAERAKAIKEKKEREEREKLEREQREKEEAEERLKFGHDTDKFLHLANQIEQHILALDIWEFFSSKKGKEEAAKMLSECQWMHRTCIELHDNKKPMSEVIEEMNQVVGESIRSEHGAE